MQEAGAVDLGDGYQVGGLWRLGRASVGGWVVLGAWFR